MPIFSLAIGPVHGSEWIGHGNVMMIEGINGFAGVVDVRQNVQVAKVGFNFHVWGPGW